MTVSALPAPSADAPAPRPASGPADGVAFQAVLGAAEAPAPERPVSDGEGPASGAEGVVVWPLPVLPTPAPAPDRAALAEPGADGLTGDRADGEAADDRETAGRAVAGRTVVDPSTVGAGPGETRTGRRDPATTQPTVRHPAPSTSAPTVPTGPTTTAPAEPRADAERGGTGAVSAPPASEAHVHTFPATGGADEGARLKVSAPPPHAERRPAATPEARPSSSAAPLLPPETAGPDRTTAQPAPTGPVGASATATDRPDGAAPLPPQVTVRSASGRLAAAEPGPSPEVDRRSAPEPVPVAAPEIHPPPPPGGRDVERPRDPAPPAATSPPLAVADPPAGQRDPDGETPPARPAPAEADGAADAPKGAGRPVGPEAPPPRPDAPPAPGGAAGTAPPTAGASASGQDAGGGEPGSETSDADVPVSAEPPPDEAAPDAAPDAVPDAAGPSRPAGTPSGPGPGPRAVARPPGAWSSLLVQQIGPALEVAGEWATLAVDLGDGDGSMTVRARRDEGRLVVAVHLSDPAVGAAARGQADEIRGRLEQHYGTAVDLSFEQGEGGRHADDARRPQDAPPRPAPRPGPNAPPPPSRPTTSRREWIG